MLTALGISPKPLVEPPLDQAIEAFVPLEGEVKARPPLPTPDRRGSGWRIKNNVLESASGLRVPAPKDCAVEGGIVAHLNMWFSEALIMCADPERSVRITPYRIPGGTAANAAALERTLLADVELDEETTTAKVAGKEVKFHRWRSENNVETLQGLAHLGDDFYVDVRVEYGPPFRDRVPATLDATLDSITHVTGSELDKLRASFRAAPRITRTAQDMSYRDGVILDFKSGLRWALPKDGVWRPRLGTRALSSVENASVVMFEPTLDLLAYAFVEYNVSDPAFHDEHHGTGGTPLTGFDLGDGSQRVTEHVDDAADIPQRRLIATAVRDGTGYWIDITFPKGFKDRGRDLARKLLAGVSVKSPPQATERTNTAFVDRRLGFSLTLPSTAVEMQSNIADDRTVAFYKADSALMGIVAIALDEGKIDALVDKAIKDLTTIMNREVKEVPVRSKTQLVGYDADRLQYKGALNFAVSYVVTGNNTLYMLATGGPKDTDLTKNVALIPTNHGWE